MLHPLVIHSSQASPAGRPTQTWGRTSPVPRLTVVGGDLVNPWGPKGSSVGTEGILTQRDPGCPINPGESQSWLKM